MERNHNRTIAIFTLIFLGMAFSAYVFVEPVNTIIFIVGGVALGILALYGFALHIAERREMKSDQTQQTARAQNEQEGQAQIQVRQETINIEEIEEGLGLPTF